MAYNHSKGKVGKDGVTRYYVPSKHAWETLEEIETQRKADENADSIASVVAIVAVGGGLLFMLIVTLSSL